MRFLWRERERERERDAGGRRHSKSTIELLSLHSPCIFRLAFLTWSDKSSLSAPGYKVCPDVPCRKDGIRAGLYAPPQPPLPFPPLPLLSQPPTSPICPFHTSPRPLALASPPHLLKQYHEWEAHVFRLVCHRLGKCHDPCAPRSEGDRGARQVCRRKENVKGETSKCARASELERGRGRVRRRGRGRVSE
jgi:hypothetical protein